MVNVQVGHRCFGTSQRWLVGHGPQIQPSSTLSPVPVHSLSNYRVCPIAVQAKSKLCQDSADFQRAWTDTGLQNQRFVQVLPKQPKFFHTGQTLDRGWICKNCGQGSYFLFLKREYFVYLNTFLHGQMLETV